MRVPLDELYLLSLLGAVEIDYVLFLVVDVAHWHGVGLPSVGEAEYEVLRVAEDSFERLRVVDLPVHASEVELHG